MARRCEPLNRLDHLAALLDRVPDQAHPAELSRHEDAGYVGLEVGVEKRDVDAAGGRSTVKSRRPPALVSAHAQNAEEGGDVRLTVRKCHQHSVARLDAFCQEQVGVTAGGLEDLVVRRLAFVREQGSPVTGSFFDPVAVHSSNVSP